MESGKFCFLCITEFVAVLPTADVSYDVTLSSGDRERPADYRTLLSTVAESQPAKLQGTMCITLHTAESATLGMGDCPVFSPFLIAHLLFVS
ncbi:hypothetical protein AB205_0167970 [Aquarana catesbeiana]|uniref:Uncharacterized protein n=1 Tax=Aquarana catesbeiana TaxID=8400 RepID=A0A2G9QCQ8_AQUCT|nr:hypothetical protein AB205_0167970 [Aquarana catesbeiana]